MKTRKQFTEWDQDAFKPSAGTRRPTITTTTMVSDLEASVEQSRSNETTYLGNIQPIEMRLSDEKLMQTAVNAARSIRWNTLHREVVAPGTLWERKRTVDDDSAVFTKTDETAGKFAVLAVSELQCSLQELQELMQAPSANAYTQLMDEMWGSQFKHGDILHEVTSASTSQSRWNPELTQSLVRSNSSSTDSNTHLTLKHAVFEKPRLFGHNEEWFYLDLLKEFNDAGNSRRSKRNVFTKTIVSLHPDQLLADSSRHYQHAQLNSSTVFGLLLEEEPSGQVTRVRVYAEGSLRSRKKKRSCLTRLIGYGQAASFRAMKNRVIGAIKITDALLTLLRRRQLGLQRFTMANSMQHCDHLTAIQTLESSSNELEMSGFSVSSSVYDSEMKRMHESQTAVSERDPIEMHIAAASSRRGTARTESTSSSSSSVLADLLEDTLTSATGRARQASVLKVIKSMVEQDEAEQRSLNASFVSNST